MQSRSPLSTEIDAILQYRWFHYSITITKLQEKCLQIDSHWRGPPPCGAPLFLMGHFRQVFLLEPQKEPKRVPLLPTAREARPRGCSPLGTPKVWSKKQKAKTCRSAARFLTLFTSSPIDPSGAKINSMGVELMAPLEGSSRAAGEGWPGGQKSAPNHPSVTCGDSSPQGEPLTRPIEFILAPEGSIGEEVKSVKKRAALLHVLAFCFFDPLFGVPRGEQPLGRASRAIGSSGHLFRFLFGCPKRKN